MSDPLKAVQHPTLCDASIRGVDGIGGYVLGPCVLPDDHEGMHKDTEGAMWKINLSPPATGGLL